jgi:hypothetical protein
MKVEVKLVIIPSWFFLHGSKIAEIPIATDTQDIIVERFLSLLNSPGRRMKVTRISEVPST